MATERGNAILTDASRFEVLGLISIALPGPWWWHHEDVNGPNAVGAVFYCFGQDREHDLGYLAVFDATLDPEEPDISNCDQSNVSSIDRYLEQGVRRVMETDGRQFKRWMQSHLNHRTTGKALVSAYVGEDRGRDRQYIDARMRIGQRNVIVAGCFDVSRADELAAPIWLAMSDAAPLFRQ